MTKRKPKQGIAITGVEGPFRFRQPRQPNGRFAPWPKWIPVGDAFDVDKAIANPVDVTCEVAAFLGLRTETINIVRAPYCDEIYRPKKIGWLERALQWFTWNRSRA